MGEATQEEGWVVCRIFKKKIHCKNLDSPISSSSLTGETRSQTLISPSEEGALEHILEYMGRSCEEEDEQGDNGKRFLGPMDTAFNNTLHDRFMKLPSLESPNSITTTNEYQHVHVQMVTDNDSTIVNQVSVEPNSVYHSETDLYNWAALDRFVASRLNGQTETSKQLACSFNNIEPNTTMPFSYPYDHDHLQLQQLLSSSSSPNRPYQEYNNEFDLRTYAPHV